ncbi:MAG: class I SAM-dependent methyltransferase [Pirellulaceae bacterium]
MKTIKGSIYDWPKYYEFVYGSDWQAETEFLQGCFNRFVDGPVYRLFEPACGTGRLVFRLAQAGFSVSGIDLNPKAIAFCNERLERHELPPSCFVADICDFKLDSRQDAAFNTINSFRHLESESAALRHLNCMADAVRPGGIYVLGLHLLPTESEPDEEEAWSHRRGHLQVNTRMWLVDRDEEMRYETHAFVFDVYTPTRQFRIRDQFRFRTYTLPQFLELLEQVPAWQVAAVHDFAYDLDSPVPLDSETQDAVFILQRAAA